MTRLRCTWRKTRLPDGSELPVRVTPRASRERLENAGDVLKVYTTAPPTDGQANNAVIKLVSKALGVPKSRINIKRGGSSRDKLLWIEGLGPKELASRLKRI